MFYCVRKPLHGGAFRRNVNRREGCRTFDPLVSAVQSSTHTLEPLIGGQRDRSSLHPSSVLNGRSITICLARDRFDVALNDISSKRDQLRAITDNAEIRESWPGVALSPCRRNHQGGVKEMVQGGQMTGG